MSDVEQIGDDIVLRRIPRGAGSQWLVQQNGLIQGRFGSQEAAQKAARELRDRGGMSR